MGERLKGKVAVVTGAGRGIGRGVALLMAEEGAKVVVNDLGGGPDGSGAARQPADEVVAEIKKKGGIAVANYDTVATTEGGERIIKAALDHFGRLDILVNNAGILRDRMVFNMSNEEWDVCLKVHLYGHFNCTKPACVIMRQQRSGRIINFSSESGLGNMGQANYSAAKEGIVGFTRTLARDMGRYGVTANAIRPRAATRLTLSPELLAAREKKAAMGLPSLTGPTAGEPSTAELPPEGVAPFVVWLATDASANVNGRTFTVYEGYVALLSEPVPMRNIYKEGRWTVDELFEIMPWTIAKGLQPPVPPAPAK